MAGRVSLSRDLIGTLLGIAKSPPRLAALGALGFGGLLRLGRFFTEVAPVTLDALAAIRREAAKIPADELRMHAIESIETKSFHVHGGAILASFFSRADIRRYVAIIAPLETIYDYLDTVCDRVPDVPQLAYATVHEALLDAVDLERTPQYEYYRNGPVSDDGGYLRGLVDTVRAQLAELPTYAHIRPHLAEVAQRYTELQTHKHGPPGTRETECDTWFRSYITKHANGRATVFGEFTWYEFAAACGSSLPVFALIAEAFSSDVSSDELAPIFQAYFPYVSALHILLDYYVDQAEDRSMDELNFVACYASEERASARLAELGRQAIAAAPNAEKHVFLIRAMCGFYLSHPKVFAQGLADESARILTALQG